jgi:hypothetical protein
MACFTVALAITVTDLHPRIASGDTPCSLDHQSQRVGQDGELSNLQTFNQHDIDHIKSLGWNFIRLGVYGQAPSPERRPH